jgi:signal transduction histidine kinase
MCGQPLDSPGRPVLLPPELATQLAHMAHDLRVPLTTLQTVAEVLSEDWDRLEPAQLRQMVTALHRNTLWLQQLVTTLTDPPPTPPPADGQSRVLVGLRTTLAQIEPVVQPLLAARQQSLTVDGPAELPAVWGHPQQLGQVYVNLLSNASKFTAPGTFIRVHLQPGEQSVRVAVEDRGSGFPPAALPHLFEPYYRAAEAAATPGTGLGLAIVQQIIAAHGGQVGAENRRGGGARVWFTLPRAE